MKHLSSFFILTLGAFMFFSCKKTESLIQKPEEAPKTAESVISPHFNPNARLVNGTDINRNGYFVFPDNETLDSFRLYAVGHTHSQVKAYLPSIGFSSYGATIYNSYTTQVVTDEQSSDYILDDNLIVQIGNILYRPIPAASCGTVKWDFVLTMSRFNLNGTNLALLQAGTYDSTSMNQFATNSTDTTFSVENFMVATPTGHKETSANPCPLGLENARPCLGKTHSVYQQCGQPQHSGTGYCIKACEIHEVTDSYAFWIHTKHKDVVTSSQEYIVPQSDCN